MMEAISEEENDEEESDDLSRLSYLDGSVILDTLRQRYRQNKYYVCIKLKSYCPRLSSSVGYMRSTKSPNLELFSERTSPI
jgi:hypothetical protein